MVGHTFSKAAAVVFTARGCIAIAHVRMDPTNREAIEQYYDLLEKILQQTDLMKFPAQMYETRAVFHWILILLTSLPKKDKRRFVTKYQERRKKITVQGCVNAIGQSIPSMVIFEGKYLNYISVDHKRNSLNILWYEW